MPGLVETITRQRENFGPAEARLADAITAAPSEVLQMTLAALATRAAVSEPTVIRLCRKLGCTGFPDFRLELARDLAGGAPFIQQEIALGETTGAVIGKVVGAAVSALTQLGRALDPALLDRAADHLARAHAISFFGTGASSVVARDAQQKFMHLDVPCLFHADSHLQQMAAALLRSTDVALCFSFTGETADITRTAHHARTAGAVVVAVTRTGSALARASDVALGVDTEENTFVYSPATTRIAHLVVLDILATAVALRRGPGVAARFKAMKDAIAHQRLPGAGEND